jgi:hypothetical protein
MQPRLEGLGERDDLLRPNWDASAAKLIQERD